ncbi:hypothetical protein Syn7502_00283 [Synechococcus sp. PCC 7502]|uniref:hypothetical protein n=1 Tax=Synechococcus sp. PCC 7502 TaxID=1173263 RepID=UPI00029FFE08|nr:hypothetical protein [Synechococcus sp. PCC 7502]AFY72450.1 hypothetical protein Syn7502_00283 [Synechococcus sp. PCC 7502]
MTGFIRGLFGSKPKQEDSAAKAKKDAGAFFLDADSAKTYGDIDYMRTPKAVTKSFPKGLGEVTEVVSSIEKQESVGELEQKSEQKIESQSQFRKPDIAINTSTDMDIFRKMAKDIKKS